jgi:hypothetical protein
MNAIAFYMQAAAREQIIMKNLVFGNFAVAASKFDDDQSNIHQAE